MGEASVVPIHPGRRWPPPPATCARGPRSSSRIEPLQGPQNTTPDVRMGASARADIVGHSNTAGSTMSATADLHSALEHDAAERMDDLSSRVRLSKGPTERRSGPCQYRSSTGLFVLRFGGGDDGNRTRVNGFADRSLTTRARRHRPTLAGCPAVDSNARLTDPKSAVLPLDDGAIRPIEASRSSPAGQKNGAEDGTRTRDPHLGKVMLYQLSHFRPFLVRCAPRRWCRGSDSN